MNSLGPGANSEIMANLVVKLPVTPLFWEIWGNYSFIVPNFPILNKKSWIYQTPTSRKGPEVNTIGLPVEEQIHF